MAFSRSHVHRLIFALLIAFLGAVPSVTFAAGFFGPIVPASCHCDKQAIQGGEGTINTAPDYGCVLLLIQNLVKIGVSLGVILCVIWIAYAGFSLMISGGRPEARSQGKTRVANALIGIVVLLCSWLIVNFVMGVLYDGSFGNWNSILAGSGNDNCITAKQPTAISVSSIVTGITPGTISAGDITPNSGSYGTTGAQCSVSNQACSVNTLEGYGLSSSQANIMSCIAVTESSGNPGTPPYNQTHPGSKSTACGTFQITQTTWNRTASGACSSFSSCTNAICNVQVAAALVKNHGYSDWTCPGCNNKAQACITKYSGS